MGFWSNLFGKKKTAQFTPKVVKTHTAKRAAKSKSKSKSPREFVIFDKYTDRVIRRVKAASEGGAAKLVTSDDHRVMSAARWDREHR